MANNLLLTNDKVQLTRIRVREDMSELVEFKYKYKYNTTFL